MRGWVVAIVGCETLVASSASFIRSGFRLLLSFEGAFCLFLFAGRIKTHSVLSGLPFDLTVFALLLSMAWGVSVLLSARRIAFRRSGVVLAAGLFFAFTAASFIWSPAEVYGRSKAVRLLAIGGWCFWGAYAVIGSNRERLYRFGLLVMVVSTWFCLEVFVRGALSPMHSGGFITVGGDRYLGVGRVLALGGAVAFGAFWSAESGRTRNLSGVLLSAITVALLIVGARGPAVSLGLAVALVSAYSLFKKSEGTWRGRITAACLITTLVIGLTFWVATSGVQFTTLDRLSILFGRADYGVSVEHRLDAYAVSLRAWAQRPIVGHGLGASGIILGGSDERMYPHNIFLELGLETGIIGVALFIMFLGSSWRAALAPRERLGTLEYSAITAAVVLFINAQFSGDLNDNRWLYSALAILAAIPLPVSPNQGRLGVARNAHSNSLQTTRSNATDAPCG